MANAIALYTHPDYDKNKGLYTRIRALYEGDHDVLTGAEFLWEHLIESKDDDVARQLRAGRQQRTRYLNLVEIITSLWVSYFFKKAPSLDDSVQELFADNINDVDGYGTSLFRLIKDQVLPQILLYGSTYVLVDSFKSSAKNRSAEQASGQRPFIEVLEPLCVPDWAIESGNPARAGKLNFLRSEYRFIPPRLSSKDEPKILTRSNLYSITDGTYTVEIFEQEQKKQNATIKNEAEQWALVDTAQIPRLSELPISYIQSESWLKDVCEEALRHYNLRSNKDNILYQQGYQKMFIKGIGSGDTDAIKALNEYVYSLLPENGDVKSIDPVNIAPYENAEREALDATFKVGLNQLRRLSSDSKDGQSAESQDAERHNTYALVESTVDDLETLTNSVIKDWAKFQTGKDNFDGKVTFDRSFTEESFDQFLQVFNAFRDEFRKVPIVTREATKRAVSKLGFDDEVLADAIKAIDAAKMESEVDQANDPINKLFGGNK